jgi:hypothetical protein
MRAVAIVLFLTMFALGAFCAEPAVERFDDFVIVDGNQRLPCRVLGIGKDGKVLLRTAFFEGEVRAPLQYVASMMLKRSAVEQGGDVVLLSNGDYLIGAVKGISAKSVTLASSALGVVKIPRATVVQLRFGQESGGGSLHSDFALGLMEPWKPLSGSWRVADGALICGSSSTQYIATPLEQAGATTYTFSVDFTATRAVYTNLILFADSTANRRGSNNVTVNFTYGNFTAYQTVAGRMSRVGNGRIPQDIQSKRAGEFRVAYDPGNGRLHIWGNNKLMGQYKVAKPVTKGKFIILQCGRTQKISTFSAVPGFSAPLGAVSAGGDVARDTVALRNGERRVGGVQMADGDIRVQTTLGEQRHAIKDVAGIVFRRKGRATPKPTARDAVVNLHRSRISIVPAAMGTDALIGRSPVLGSVKLKRTLIARIALPRSSSAPTGPHTVALKGGPTLRCTVLGVEPGKPLTATFSSLDGPVRVVRDRIARATLSGSVEEKPGGYVLLADGDRLFGQVLSVTPETVRMRAPAFGDVSVPLKHVAQIVLAHDLPQISSTDFAKGDAKPWRLPAESWQMKDGVMTVEKGTAVMLDQNLEDPVSLEMTVEAGGKFSVFLFSDSQKGSNALQWKINGSRAELWTVNDDAKQKKVSGRLIIPGKGRFVKGKLLFTYNPTLQQAALFAEDEFLCGGRLENAPVTGKHMVILCESALSLRGMRLLSGTRSIVKESEGEDDNHLVLLVDGDRVSLEAVTIAGRKATVKLPYGERTFPLEKARAFIFARKRRTPVPGAAGVVRVGLHRSSFRLVLESLTDKALVGRTTYGADVKVPREAVRSIAF